MHPNLAEKSVSLVETTKIKKGMKYQITKEAIKSFHQLREALVQSVTLHYPPPGADLVVRTDASDVAYASMLFYYETVESKRVPMPIGFHSKLFNMTQRRWDPVSREFYSITYAVCERWKIYLLGRKFLIETDSLTICSKNFLKEAKAAKHIRWMESLSQFDFVIRHITTKENVAVDCLTRNISDGLEKCGENEMDQDDPYGATVVNMTECYSSEIFAKEQEEDDTLALIKCAIEGGFKPPKNNASEYLMRYLTRWDHILLDDKNCLLMNWYNKHLKSWKNLICVPDHMQKDLVKRIHEDGHLSQDKLIYRLREKFYFPELATQAQLVIGNCEPCARFNAEGKQKLKAGINSFIPRKIGEIIGMDVGSILSDKNRSAEFNHFLVAVDFFSTYVFIRPLRRVTATTVANEFLNHIIPFTGVPNILVTDSGSEFSNMIIKNICTVLGIDQRRGPAYRPTYNSRSKACVKLTKNCLKKFCLKNPKHWAKAVVVQSICSLYREIECNNLIF